jgi:SAM-dependent methyltransferase
MANETVTRSDGKSFNAIAADYDRSRPAYPDELISRACELAGLHDGDRVLDLGCGTGQLTSSLVARGLDVTAIEPGEHLIALAQRNLGGAAPVHFVHARFEDALIPAHHFRAVFAAASFHWIDPAVSWEGVARALEPGGTLALIQYCGLDEERSRDDQQAMMSMVERNAPEAAATWPPVRGLADITDGVGQRRANVSDAWGWLGGYSLTRSEAGDLFCDVQVSAVPMLQEQSGEELYALLCTASFHQRLAPARQQAFEREFVELQQRLGRPIRSSTVAVLVTARRTPECVQCRGSGSAVPPPSPG